MADGVLVEKFEIEDPEYQVQHGEANSEHQFGNERVYDIPDSFFDSSSTIASVFAGKPTTNNSPSNIIFDKSNFSVTDVSGNSIFFTSSSYNFVQLHIYFHT